MRLAIIVVVLTTALATAAIASAKITRIPHRCTSKNAPRLCAIHAHKHRADHARGAMGLPRLPYAWVAEGQPRLRDRLLTLWIQHQRHWQHQLAHWKHAQASTPWSAAWLRDALCVKSHEGAWTSNTGNGYTGGMQFDTATWLSNGGGRYAAEAYLATPNEQLRIAYRTWQARGWAPWPNTSAMCGL
jgi:hypothetical protein